MHTQPKQPLRRPQSSYNIKKHNPIRPSSSNKQLTNLSNQYLQYTSQQQLQETETQKYNTLRRIYNEAVRKIKNYQIQDALNLFKSYIQKLASQFGTSSTHFQKDFPALIQTVCNYSIRIQQETNNHELPLMILLWAEDITNPIYEFEKPLSSRCLVYNNLGCVYRRNGKLQNALNCLEQALSLIQADDQIPHQTITYLNITAILSQMGLHERALEFAHQSYETSSQDLSAFLRDETNKDDDSAYLQKLKYVAISMHNIGIEEECCGQLETSISWYIKSTQYIEKHFGQDEPLYNKFNGSLIKAKKKQSSMIKESSQKLKASLLPLRKSQTLTKVGKISLLQNKSTVKNFYKEEQKQFKEDEPLKQSQSMKQFKQIEKPMKQQLNSSTQPKDERKEITELKTLGVLEWSEDEDDKEKQQSDGESVQAVMEQEEKEVGQRKEFIGEEMQREERVNFLERMTVYEIEKAKKQEEEQKEDQQEDELVVDMDQDKELDELKVIKIQSYIRMKLQQKKYQRQLEETKKRKKADEYEQKIKKLQKWCKYMLFRMRMKKITRELVKTAKCTRYPEKEFMAAVNIQKHIKRFLQQQQQKSIITLRKQKGFLIIMTCQIEPVFWGDEKRIQQQKCN